MNTHADKTRENKSQAVSTGVSQMKSGGEAMFQFVDNRPEAIAQRKPQEMANNSPQAKQAAQLQVMADNYSAKRQLPFQKKENKTGLPDNLKSGIEHLSGYSMDDVKVHRHSDKPAQLQAHAYAQGTDIHLASGQEKHLPHEAWHVVQQKQGRVKPTMQMKGRVNVNDDVELEKEADMMGETALQMVSISTAVSGVIKPTTSPVSNHILQAKWVEGDDDDEGRTTYRQDIEVDERIWEVRLSTGDEEDKVDKFRYNDGQEDSDWRTAEEWTELGKSPPLGSRFQDQRNKEEQEKEGADDFAFQSADLGVETPLVIKQAHKYLAKLIKQIRKETQEDLDMLDMIVAEEFQQIAVTKQGIVAALAQNNLSTKQRTILRETFSPEEIIGFVQAPMTNKQVEKLEAGLRYKRVYEHEQNIITIKRRASCEIDKASDAVKEKYNMDIEKYVNDEENTHTITARNVEGENYDLGTLFFGASQFEKASDPVVKDGSEVFKHKETGQEFVQDYNYRYTPKIVKRAIRYEDTIAILAGEEMPTKMDYGDPLSGKEATDYGGDFKKGARISHEQRVIGQIRGYGRFLSATTSDQMATSTSRGSYDSPFGSVKIDLAQLPYSGYTEAHSEEAMGDIFGIDDLGQVEFIPKHLSGEDASVKAGRDAYRAREIVVDSPPVDAVRTIPRKSKEVGVAIVGISSSANKESVTTALGQYAGNVSYMEVNSNYKREIDGHEGRSAFVFFKNIDDINTIIHYLQSVRGDNKIAEDAYVGEIPSSEVLSNHLNPEQKIEHAVYYESEIERLDTRLVKLNEDRNRLIKMLPGKKGTKSQSLQERVRGKNRDIYICKSYMKIYKKHLSDLTQ